MRRDEMTQRPAVARIVPLVRFRAGELHAAVAADSVDAIAPLAAPAGPGRDRGDAMHLAVVLGDPAEAAADTQRLLRLRHGVISAEIVVDGPVVMTNLTARDILPIRNQLARAGCVLGFARLQGDVVALLDVPRLVAAARARVAHLPDDSGPSDPDDRDASETP